MSEAIASSSGVVARQFAEWRTPAKLRAIGQKLAHYERVKALSNPEKASKISEFYLPPRFAYAGGKPCIVKRFEDFGIDDQPLIEGTAGQGKSIFMRQLLVEELRQAKRLPILVELRRLTNQIGLRVQITDQMTALGFPYAAHLWALLADTGQAVLLLDGFDEIKEGNPSCRC